MPTLLLSIYSVYRFFWISLLNELSYFRGTGSNSIFRTFWSLIIVSDFIIGGSIMSVQPIYKSQTTQLKFTIYKGRLERIYKPKSISSPTCSWISLSNGLSYSRRRWYLKRMWVYGQSINFFSYRSQKYRKYIKFNRMKGAVNCLSFNPNGELLASGGM